LPLLPLRGRTRSEQSAILRAARALEALGRIVVVRLWRDDYRAVCSFAARPGATLGDGRAVAELSVERVSHGTGSTFTGSLRQIARELGVSVSQVRRDLRSSEQGGPSPEKPRGEGREGGGQ
jgi:hypothetical protein